MSSIQNINNNHQHELQKYILGLTQQTDKNSIISILSNDLNQYQKAYVDTLVDITTLTIRSSWPIEMSTTKDGQPVVNTNIFVRHLLKRSRATRSTLQLAIFYLFRIRPHIGDHCQVDPIIKCGRRMFLAALISAHKYLYDNTFTNASWAKISKLPVMEVNNAERALLRMLDYRLYVPIELYQKFESQLREAMPPHVANNTTTVINNKRNYSFVHPITTTKKQKHHHSNIRHGIPTPEDDKVEF